MRLQANIKKNGTMAALFGLFLTLALLVALPGAAVAGDYYVDINTGSDTSGDGSVGNPWKTLHYALMQSFVPGDVLHVAPGFYSVDNGEDDNMLSIMEMQGFTLQGDPAGGTVIDATSPMYYWSYGLDISNSTGITIADLEIMNSFNSGIYVYGGSNITITRCSLHDNASAGVYLYDCDASVTVAGNKIYDNPAGILGYADMSDCSPSIINNLIYSTDGFMDRGIFLDVMQTGTASPTIYHNTIDGAYMTGIDISNPYGATVTARIQYNIITNSGTGISDSDALSNPIVDYNNLHNNTTNYGGVTPGANDISGAPLYNDTGVADYHLMSGSPCIDAAVTSNIPFDLDGTDRATQGTYPDIGCYEHLVMPPSDNLPPVAPTCPSPVSFTVFAPGQPVTLQGGPYSDPENDSHLSSHWMVTRADVGYFNHLIKGEAPFNHVASTGNLTRYTLGGENFVAGLAYHWTVGYQDSGSLGYSFPVTDKNATPPQRVFVVGTSETASLPPVEPGTEVEDYRMVSVTHIPANPSATAVLGDDLAGGYNTTHYRIGVYDCEMGAGGYREYPNFTVGPGGAAWVLAREGLEPDITGVPVTTEVPVAVSLHYNTANGNGWNMVGPPNARNYTWAEVGVVVHDPETGEELFASPVSGLDANNPYIDVRLWSWSDGAYDATTTMMEAGCGYWVRAKQSHVNLMFPFEFGGPALIGQTEEGKGVKTWLARSLDYVKQAAETLFAPASAIAADDGPPPPMASLNYTSGDSSVDMSCFVSTLLEE